jgi:hypothetical protein
MAKILHLEECDSFLIGIVKSVCEMLRCRVPCSLPLFPFIPLLLANTFLLSRVLSWTLLRRHVRFLSELWLSRKQQRELTVFGLIPDAVMPLCFFKILLSILEKQLMVVKDLLRPCTLSCSLAILCLEAFRSYSTLLDLVSEFIG